MSLVCNVIYMNMFIVIQCNVIYLNMFMQLGDGIVVASMILISLDLITAFVHFGTALSYLMFFCIHFLLVAFYMPLPMTQ